MNILVTGGAGYLGSVLVPELLKCGHKVALMDRFLWGVAPILHFATHHNLEIIAKDVGDTNSVRSAIKGQDLVIHLASTVGYPACAADHQEAVNNNVEATRNVVRALEGRGIIFASTCSIYGRVEGLCTEATQAHPLTVYGQTKWEAEKIVRDAGGVRLRFAALFGVSPRLRTDLLVHDFICHALCHGKISIYEWNARRAFLHVRDAAATCLKSIECYERMAGDVFNVCDESATLTKWELALKIREYVDFVLLREQVGTDCDGRDYVMSCAKLRSLGYKPEVMLDQGIRDLIKVLEPLQRRPVANPSFEPVSARVQALGND